LFKVIGEIMKEVAYTRIITVAIDDFVLEMFFVML